MNPFEQALATYLTTDQLRAIQSRRIGIGGAGGLGSNIALLLVRCGFRQLEIIDQDTIDFSNLNRQQYFLDEVGRPKGEALRDRLLAVNPDAQITLHQQTWTTERGADFFNGCDFVVEALDQAEEKYRFVEFYRDRVPNVISGSGMGGWKTQPALTVQRAGNVIVAGDQDSDTGHGHPPLAPRVTACAALMAGVILELTLEQA